MLSASLTPYHWKYAFMQVFFVLIRHLSFYRQVFSRSTIPPYRAIWQLLLLLLNGLYLGNLQHWCTIQRFELLYTCKHTLEQGILEGEISLYHWPPFWLVWNQLYGNWHFFVFRLQNRLIQTSQTGGQRYSDTSPFSIPCSGVGTLHGSTVAFTGKDDGTQGVGWEHDI
jgi:hypothetical protein